MSTEIRPKKPASPICRSILHVGAHRTGTTLFQEYLYRRRHVALDKGIRFIETVECRRNGLLDGVIYNRTDDKIYLRDKQIRLKDNLTFSLNSNMRLVFSEENILGTMQKCVRTGSLYPDAHEMVARLGNILEMFDTILISVRPIHKWWRSVQGFLEKTGQIVEPNMIPKDIKSVLESRTWSDVIQDVISAAGEKTIIVRDFDYFVSNPKRQLLKATRWPDLKEIPGIEEKVMNSSLLPAVDSSATEQNRPKNLTGRWFDESTQNQTIDLDAFYLDDLERIKGIIGRRGRVLRSKHQ